MNFESFFSKYFYNDGCLHSKCDKPKDPFHETISLVPFTVNPSTSDFDGSVPLSGISGEFFRMCSTTTVHPIVDFFQDCQERVLEYVSSQKGMKQDGIDCLRKIISDILCVNYKFNPVDASFLKYTPLDFVIKNGKRMNSKYGDGQAKLSQYLYSLLLDNADVSPKNAKNLFTSTIHEAMSANEFERKEKAPKEYYTLPFIQTKFTSDLVWLLQKEDSIILRYIDLFFYFYCCYALMQTIIRLDASNYTRYANDRPYPYYYILDSEKASDKRDVVRKGWSTILPNEYIQKLYGRMQAVDMLNTLISPNGSPVGLYPELLLEFEKTPFDANIKSKCEEILQYCKVGKLAALKGRTSGSKADSIPMIEDIHVSSYHEFFQKLESICKGYQSFEYHGRMLKRIFNLMKVRLLQTRRGRGNTVLVLDDEMLTLLIAMMTREKRCKLKVMYSHFRDYGICFDLTTRQTIEERLLKLNFLDRKSDSGEAQYVSILL